MELGVDDGRLERGKAADLAHDGDVPEGSLEVLHNGGSGEVDLYGGGEAEGYEETDRTKNPGCEFHE